MTSNILEWKEKPKKDICFQEVCLHVYCSQKMVTCDIQLNTAHTKVRLVMFFPLNFLNFLLKEKDGLN